MRIGLDHTSEIGVRAGRLLLGEPDLALLGIVRRDTKDPDTRLRRIDDLSDVDVVVTDDPGSTILDEAVKAGTTAVLWDDGAEIGDVPDGAVVVKGANLVAGIGRSLLVREWAISRGAGDAVLAWTEPGRPLRHGEPVTFPDPVGARWGRRRGRSQRPVEIAAPVPDEWAGILVRTSTADGSRTVAIADLNTHLEAIALAAGAIVAASGLVPAGVHTPDEYAEEYLLAALRIGLDIASFTEVS